MYSMCTYLERDVHWSGEHSKSMRWSTRRHHRGKAITVVYKNWRMTAGVWSVSAGV